MGPGQVRVGALQLTCDGLGRRSPGERVTLGLRPEEVRIRGVEAGSPNAIPVRVELLDFLGAFCRATLRPTAASDLVVRSDFSANAIVRPRHQGRSDADGRLAHGVAARVRRRHGAGA